MEQQIAEGEVSPRKHHWLKEPWAPGQSGNPAGRPKGTRNKLAQAFCDDLYAKWQEDGASVIDRVIEERPHEFLKVIASLMPKEIKIEHTDEMTDDQLRQRVKQIADELGIFLGLASRDAEASRSAETPPRQIEAVALPPVHEAT